MTLGGFWQRMRVVVEKFSRRRRPRRSRDGRHASLFAEVLEQRELLSVNQIGLDTVKGQLTIGGTSSAENVVVSMDSPTVVRVRAQSADGLVERTFQRSAVSLIYYYGGDGNDHFQNLTDIRSRALGEGGDDYLSGGGGVDELFGGDGNDELVGNGGNDVILGDAGNDTLRGGDGNDQLYGIAGDDTLEGEQGDDLLSGGTGNDTLLGGANNDKLMGYEGADFLDGGDGDDELDGMDGDDRLEGGFGRDLLIGGVGDDVLRGGDGDDQLYGSENADWLDGGNGNDLLAGGEGNDMLFGGAGKDTLLGHGGDDFLIGGEDNDVLRGGDGNDQLYGIAGDDLLEGDQGNDLLSGGVGNDSLYGGADNDRLLGYEGADSLHGGDGDDILQGMEGDDWLEGGLGRDVLIGDAGNDVLMGGEGDDQLYGVAGADSLDGGNGHDLLSGGAENDTLVGGAGNDKLLGYEGDDYLYGGDGNDFLRGMEGNDQLYGIEGDDILEGQQGDDLLSGGVGNDLLSGGAGNDKLLGYEGADILDGGDGHDILEGMDGDDRMVGGLGNDTLFGGAGRDELLGGENDDTLYGNDGDDLISGGAGNDSLFGLAGNDTLFGGDGHDYLIGNQGSDRIFGDAGNDELIGEAETDHLHGGVGNDRLWTSSGQHVLVGGAGDDILGGSGGNDVLIGGDGKDVVNGYGGDDLLIGGSTIYDENAAQLSALFAAWTAANPYAARVAQIEDESFAALLLSNESVFDDGVADEIFGHGGQDWFIQTGFAAIYDPNHNAAHEDSHDGGMTSGHEHSGPIVVDQLPPLEGYELIDSLDKIGDRAANESLHTLISHADDPSMQREHLTLNELVRYDEVTHFAVQSGNWSDSSTWSGGVIPEQGARVLIPLGVNVTVDRVLTARVDTIRVDGTLSFSTVASSELRVDTIVVTNVGRFEMGTEAAPIPANITAKLLFTDNGAIDRTADPFGISRGLISHGAVSIVGAAVTSYAAVSGAALAGSTVLTLKTIPSGWKVGDSIVLAGTYNGANQNEVRRIAAVVGNRVVLDQALTSHHRPLNADQEIHVANLTRNIQISSETSVIERRGHVMFMHSRDVHVANAGFYQLGRTDKDIPINDPVVNADWQLVAGTGTNPRARYSVHFHRTGSVDDGNPSTVTGSVVVDSPGWGFVNHSSYVDMVDNVAYGVHGAAFVTEAGDEIGSFVGNIAIGTTGSGESVKSRLAVQDFGHQGDGFWIQGTGVSLVDNISAGNDGHAFIIFAHGLVVGGAEIQFLASNLPDPSVANGAATVPVDSVPIKRFERNTGYTSAVGLSVWYHLDNALSSTTGVIADSNFWNNAGGVDLVYTNQMVLRNLVVSRTAEQPPWPTKSTGVSASLTTRNIRYENLTVSGYWHGVLLPRRGDAVVVDGSYDNYIDFHVLTAVEAGRSVLLTGDISMNTMALDTYFTYPGNPASFVFLSDRVTLNFGPYRNQRAYYLVQSPLSVPFPAPLTGIPAEYIGKTSLQLWTQYGIAIGGELAPSTALTVPWLSGLLGPAT